MLGGHWIATIGLLRFDDPFQRMHAATKAGTLGAGLVLIGTMLNKSSMDALLTGSIDRLVSLYHDQKLVAADIIDFKTDRIDGHQGMDAKVEYYRPQLEAYRRAVSRMLRLDRQRIAARLAFVGAGKVVALDEG